MVFFRLNLEVWTILLIKFNLPSYARSKVSLAFHAMIGSLTSSKKALRPWRQHVMLFFYSPGQTADGGVKLNSVWKMAEKMFNNLSWTILLRRMMEIQTCFKAIVKIMSKIERNSTVILLLIQLICTFLVKVSLMGKHKKDHHKVQTLLFFEMKG